MPVDVASYRNLILATTALLGGLGLGWLIRTAWMGEQAWTLREGFRIAVIESGVVLAAALVFGVVLFALDVSTLAAAVIRLVIAILLLLGLAHMKIRNSR